MRDYKDLIFLDVTGVFKIRLEIIFRIQLLHLFLYKNLLGRSSLKSGVTVYCLSSYHNFNSFFLYQIYGNLSKGWVTELSFLNKKVDKEKNKGQEVNIYFDCKAIILSRQQGSSSAGCIYIPDAEFNIFPVSRKMR